MDVLQLSKKAGERWVGRPGTVSCGHLEQLVDELNLLPNIRTAHPPRRVEFTKALLGLHASFDRSMILLQDVVRVLDRPGRQQRRRIPSFLTPEIAAP